MSFQGALNSEVVKPEKKDDLFCSATNRRGVNWQNTKAGTTSSAPCPEGSAGKQLWICSNEGHWQTENPNSAGCESDWISMRSSTLNHVLNNEDSTGIPDFLRELGSNTRRPMVGGDLPKVLRFLEKTVEAVSGEGWAYKHLTLANKGIIEVMNYMVRNQEIWESWENSKRKEFASRFITSAEKTMVASAKKMLQNMDSNVIVQPAITAEVSHKIKLSLQPTDYVLFPSSALWMGQTVDHVKIPREAIIQLGEDNAQVFFSSFDNLGAHMTPSDVVFTPLGSSEPLTVKRKVVSRIVGASLIEHGRQQHIDKLKKPVRITH